MSRLLSLLAACALLGACSSSSTSLHHYQLQGSEQNTDSSGPTLFSRDHLQSEHLLRLSPIAVRGTLNNRAMVIKRSAHQVYSANYHFWADAPAQLLATMAQSQLMQELDKVMVVKGAEVYAEQLQASFFQLDVSIEQFNGGLDNNAEIAGTWRLSKVDAKGKLHVLKISRFYHSQALAEDGYEALAKALSQAWQQALSEMSADINTLIASA
ncbi:PqiC family protein [Pseudoalteromonas sp. BDTF-M6]|uniref:PqiC family protein n=1 Tax=Pseudoalteromonas sp. BDTF-M6 TaxID=2796132 RepID=UPI001BB024F0|nr:PqiC family protein [Pseudoalteromonas sp. BDTF-M6]MBS3797753.1 membrane integrity-associated transporter subunit PqiC [Pseudoalteromonas sp. BDTF-M6]